MRRIFSRCESCGAYDYCGFETAADAFVCTLCRAWYVCALGALGYPCRMAPEKRVK